MTKLDKKYFLKCIITQYSVLSVFRLQLYKTEYITIIIHTTMLKYFYYKI
jgi:hypothetical protein